MEDASPDMAYRFLQVQDAVTTALDGATTLHEIVPAVLRAIGLGFHWQLGAFWLVENETQLSCVEIWHEPGMQVQRFERLSWALRLGQDEGLPGRVWKARKPIVIDDFPNDSRSFPRSAVAGEEGLRVAIGLPLLQESARGTSVSGVIEFYSEDPTPLGPGVLEMMTLSCTQIGRFMERLALERELQHELPIEMREEVIESLYLAQTAIDTGHVVDAGRLVDDMIEAGQRIARTAEGDGHPDPNDDGHPDIGDGHPDSVDDLDGDDDGDGTPH